MSPSYSPQALIISTVGRGHSSLQFASAPLPPGADPRILLPFNPGHILDLQANLGNLRQHITANMLCASVPGSSYSLLLQILVAAVWRNDLHRKLLLATLDALPSSLTLHEVVFQALVFPTLEDLALACQTHTSIHAVHLVGVRWLGRGVLPHPAKSYVSPVGFQITELRISKSLDSVVGIFLLGGLKDTLTKLLLDIPAASNISRSECAEYHVPEISSVRDNTIIMAKLAYFGIELGIMEKPDGPIELEVTKATSAVEAELAMVCPLFDRVVMPSAEVVLRLRYEPTDEASEMDLARATDEFVEGRGVLFAIVDGLAPNIRRFSNLLRERHLEVSRTSRAPSVKIEVVQGAFLGGLLVWNREGVRMGSLGP